MSISRLRAVAAAVLVALPPAVRAEDRNADPASPLAQALSSILSAPALAGARAGVVVASLDGGQVLYAHDPDELLNPASNVKLFTCAAALARLGPEFRFETEFHVDSGAGARRLFVRGKGDPSMTTERLWAIAGDLLHLGLRSVKEVIVDDGYFDAERQGPGFDQERSDRSYLAPAGALSLNFNNLAIHVAPGARAGEPGRVELEPVSDFFRLDNRTATAKAGARRRVVPSSIAEPGRQRILVAGRVPLGSRGQVFYRKIDDPPLYFGYTLKRFLELRGARVGRVRRGAIPPEATLVDVAESEPLGELVRKLLKSSNNFMAEQILKALGAEEKGPPGSWPKGVDAVEDFLAEAGLPRGTYLMQNGSGLNDANRFSARQTVKLLREMWRRFPLMADFVSALPVAGKDGTIRWRMEATDAVGRLRAKTGSLEGVTSLSGYVETRARERLVFAILVNDFAGPAGPVVRAVDAMGAALAASGGPPAELAGAVASANAVPQPAPGSKAPADLEARAAAYYRLGKAADRRNVPFLRAALRGERDPALRMAAAEAIYLCDPGGETARRTFLDNVAADGDALGRLSTLASELDALPVLGSLGDLAAEGGPEALGRLLELAPAAGVDGALADGYADTCAEVARTAPEELFAALRAAAPAAADAALGALARGLVRAGEAAHPFAEALRRAQQSGEPAAAESARDLLARLEERLAAARSADGAAAPHLSDDPATLRSASYGTTTSPAEKERAPW